MRHPSLHITLLKRPAQAGQGMELDYQGAIALTYYLLPMLYASRYLQRFD